MSTLSQTVELPTFVQAKIYEVTTHIAWHGELTGSETEAILRDKPDMTYVLRQGEKIDHFYLTYVKEGTVFTHIPFTIDRATKHWFYRNYCPHFADTLKIFIPEIMHQDEAHCFPLVAFTGK